MRFYVCNNMSVSAPTAKTKHIFAAQMVQIEKYGAEAALMSECADIWVADELKALGLDDKYGAIQYGEPGSPESGVAIVYLRSSKEFGRRLMEGTTAGGRKSHVRARPILQADIGTFRFNDGHAPLLSTGKRGSYLRKLVRKRGIKAGDLNSPRRLLVALVPWCKVYETHPITALVPRRFNSKLVHIVPKSELAGADHNAMVIDVWRRR